MLYAERILLRADMQPWNKYPSSSATIRYPFGSTVMIARPSEYNVIIVEHNRGPPGGIGTSQYRWLVLVKELQ